MPYIETIDDIVEELADRLGIFGAHTHLCTPEYPCRVCWVPEMHDRLVKALENELRLNRKPRKKESA